jgi:hypothetical protein
MDEFEIYDRLKKIHPELRFLTFSPEEDVCIIFNDMSIMCSREFIKDSETRVLMEAFMDLFDWGKE